MTDKPILFSGPMVRAILEGRKAQTRRVLKPPKGVDPAHFDLSSTWIDPKKGVRFVHWPQDIGIEVFAKPTYAPGDRLWVRESIVRAETDQGVGYQTYTACGSKVFPLTKWYHKRESLPSIHMPRWASRLTLTVTDVRVQRLQEISSFDCLKEGINADDTILREISAAHSDKHRRDEYHRAHVEPFRALWNSLHGPDAWDANPWVCAVTFTAHRCNIDRME